MNADARIGAPVAGHKTDGLLPGEARALMGPLPVHGTCLALPRPLPARPSPEESEPCAWLRCGPVGSGTCSFKRTSQLQLDVPLSHESPQKITEQLANIQAKPPVREAARRDMNKECEG